jgi:outer membrane protein TolC
VANHISIAGGLPEVSASLTNNQSVTNLTQQLSNGTTTKRPGNANNSTNASLNGSFLLFNGFRVHAAKNRLAALEKQGEQLVNVQIQNVIANVMLTYYDIVRQDSYIKTIRQSIEVTTQRKRLVEARQSVGLANNADTYQAQIDLNASEQELQSQQLILNQAKVDLMNLLTQRPDSSFTIRDTIVVDSLVNLAAVMENVAKNPELLSADQQISVNEAIAREVGAQRYPSVAINGGYTYSRSQNAAGFTLLNQNFGPYLGLSVQVPIFNGGLIRRQVRVADIDTRNSLLTRETVFNTLRTSAARAWEAYRNNLARLGTERENNRIAADLLNLVIQRFNLGVGTIVDVREAQRSFVEAGYRLVNLAYAAKVSEVELKRLANQLGI